LRINYKEDYLWSDLLHRLQNLTSSQISLQSHPSGRECLGSLLLCVFCKIERRIYSYKVDCWCCPLCFLYSKHFIFVDFSFLQLILWTFIEWFKFTLGRSIQVWVHRWLKNLTLLWPYMISQLLQFAVIQCPQHLMKFAIFLVSLFTRLHWELWNKA